MLKDFKAYQIALRFHRSCESFKPPYYLRDQLLRASSSIVLNLAEGSGKITAKEQRRFYSIALGSLRESMAILDLSNDVPDDLKKRGDEIGACLYRLCHPK